MSLNYNSFSIGTIRADMEQAMYFSPARSFSTPRLFGASTAGVVTFVAIYATWISPAGFGHSFPKPVDFVGTMTTEAPGGPEPKVVVVPDTSIPAAQPSAEPDPNLVREGPSARIQTLVPAPGAEESFLKFGLRAPGFSQSGPGVVQPSLKNPPAPAGFPLASLTAGEMGTTTMSFCVAADGRVHDVEVSASSRFRRLDDAAIEWLKAREYTPGTVKGQPTEMCGRIDYTWRVKNG